MNLQHGYSIKGKPRHKCRRILLLMGRSTTKQNEYIAFVGDGIRCKRRGRKKSARYFTHTWLKLLGGNTGHNHILLSISEGQESYEHIKMIISDHLDILAEIERTIDCCERYPNAPTRLGSTSRTHNWTTPVCWAKQKSKAVKNEKRIVVLLVVRERFLFLSLSKNESFQIYYSRCNTIMLLQYTNIINEL